MTKPARRAPPAARASAWLPAHHRLAACFVLGVAVALACPGVPSWPARALIGWNVAAWGYLAWVALNLLRVRPGDMKNLAQRQGESAPVVLMIVVIAATMSLGAVVWELAGAKGPGRQTALSLLPVAGTVISSWLLVPVLFSLAYASEWFGQPGGGLQFPRDPSEAAREPDHVDFFYFSFTIAVASQTADVSITSRPMRKLVLMQSVLSFAFNTAVLAFGINMAAQLF